MIEVEVKSLKSRIFANFEQKDLPFDNKEITCKFIEYLALIEIEEDEIYSFFEEYSQTWNFKSYEKTNKFKNYHRIYFWMQCKFYNKKEKLLHKIERYFAEITEYIIKKEKSRLIEDIKKYFKENEQELNSYKYDYDKPSYWDFNPSIWLTRECPNELYPVELFEKIKEAIPKEHGYHFEYKPSESRYSDGYTQSGEENKESEKKKIIESTLPQGVLSKEMPDNEIIDKMKEYGGMFLDKAMEEKNECIYKFIMRKIGIPLWPGETEEEFINYVLKTEIIKFGNGIYNSFKKHFYMLVDHIEDNKVICNSIHEQKSHFYEEEFSNKINKIFFRKEDLIEQILQVSLRKIGFIDGKNVENISKKIHLLTIIGTKKAFFKIWEVLGTRKYDTDLCYDADLYENIINKWGAHFPVKLLKKEIEEKNKSCVLGILQSENEYAIRGLLAYANDGYNLEFMNFKFSHYESLELDNIKYCRLIILLFLRDGNDDFYGKGMFEDCDMNFLLDIASIINSNSAIGQKIKKTLEKLNIDLTPKLTSEQFDEIERLKELSYEYEATQTQKKSKIEGVLIGPKNKYEEKKYEILNTDKVPFILWEEYVNRGHYAKVRFWLYEHKKFDLQSLFSTDEYIRLRNITLERPFFFPGYSFENQKIMKECLDENFLDFCSEHYERKKKSVYYEKIWPLYWWHIIEKTYENFEQQKFENPLLPIIPEYAEYLLSRTNDIFSTAIKGIVHNEFEVFLTESRKLQIKICLKSKIIQEEEFENLMKLVENHEANYYAWSDEEIKKCLLPGTDLEKLNAILEPEFMVRIFEKSILWVIEHKNSELWQNAPWFGMQMFNKSYADRPSIWAKHLIKIADEWNGSENILRRICFALGHLREPLGDKVPKKLKEMAENPQNENTKEDILVQYSLFHHENFKKMHHEGNELKRVELCKKELIMGQNREVKDILRVTS
jgi:hypothetical protein